MAKKKKIRSTRRHKRRRARRWRVKGGLRIAPDSSATTGRRPAEPLAFGAGRSLPTRREHYGRYRIEWGEKQATVWQLWLLSLVLLIGAEAVYPGNDSIAPAALMVNGLRLIFGFAQAVFFCWGAYLVLPRIMPAGARPECYMLEGFVAAVVGFTLAAVVNLQDRYVPLKAAAAWIGVSGVSTMCLSGLVSLENFFANLRRRFARC